MPKEIINMTLERKGKNEPWGFVIIGGKDQVEKLKYIFLGFLGVYIVVWS